MKTIIYTDNTLPLAVAPLCQLLNSLCRTVSFTPGRELLRIESSYIRDPISYAELPKSLLIEAAPYDVAFLCTHVPYENNFFFESSAKEVLISFSGWNLLTDLPISNGLVYFIASILCDMQSIGQTHQQNTGCINDFWWDKRGVDVGMRAAFLCGRCRTQASINRDLQEDVDKLLDLVSTASRIGHDVLTTAVKPTGHNETVFDVFLCHNSNDKPAVRELNQSFRVAGIRTWLDEEQLSLGLPWQPELERQIGNIKAACVFVGRNGIGPWQDMEVRAFLNEFVNRGCPVIPVILQDATQIPELPLFLRQMTWVDLRQNYKQNLLRLIGVIK